MVSQQVELSCIARLPPRPTTENIKVLLLIVMPDGGIPFPVNSGVLLPSDNFLGKNKSRMMIYKK